MARWNEFLRWLLCRWEEREVENPSWVAIELASGLVQIAAAAAAIIIAVARDETVAGSVKVWLGVYTLVNFLCLPLHLFRLRRAASPDPEAIRTAEEGKDGWERLLDLFWGVWFVTGNVWLVGSSPGSEPRGGVLYALAVALLLWNGLLYAVPLLLSCCVSHPARPSLELASLPCFLFQPSPHQLSHQKCCICLTKYKEKEELRELPCTHLFHRSCVDRWLSTSASCPLCKKLLPHR